MRRRIYLRKNRPQIYQKNLSLKKKLRVMETLYFCRKKGKSAEFCESKIDFTVKNLIVTVHYTCAHRQRKHTRSLTARYLFISI